MTDRMLRSTLLVAFVGVVMALPRFRGPGGSARWDYVSENTGARDHHHRRNGALAWTEHAAGAAREFHLSAPYHRAPRREKVRARRVSGCVRRPAVEGDRSAARGLRHRDRGTPRW